MYMSLVGLDTLGRFSPIFTREITFMTSCLLSLTLSSSEKESVLEGKNLLPLGANSFLLEYTHLQKGSKALLPELSPLKVYQSPLTV